MSLHSQHECECGYVTQNKSNYNKHRKRCKKVAGPLTSTPHKSANLHSVDRKKFVCDKCGRKYQTGYGLSLHIKSKHDQNYKHECAMCGKKFNQTVQYRYHCSKHLAVGVDKCPHCKKEFSSHGSLGRHIKVCTIASKEYKCDKCQSSFAHKYSLTYLHKGKHQPPRYTCDQCGMRYAWRSSLKSHMKRHSDGHYEASSSAADINE